MFLLIQRRQVQENYLNCKGCHSSGNAHYPTFSQASSRFSGPCSCRWHLRFLLLAAGLILTKSSSLSFLLSGFRILGGIPRILAATLIIVFGLLLILVAVGIWYRRMWAFVLGLILSLAQILISMLGHDFTSFIFIRGLVVFVFLLTSRRYFLHT